MGTYYALFGQAVVKPQHTRLLKKVEGNWWIDFRYFKQHRGLRKHPDVVGFLSHYRASDLNRKMSAYSVENDYPLFFPPHQNYGEQPLKYYPRIPKRNANDEKALPPLDRTLSFLCDSKDPEVWESFSRLLPLLFEKWCLWTAHEDAIEDGNPLVSYCHGMTFDTWASTVRQTHLTKVAVDGREPSNLNAFERSLRRKNIRFFKIGFDVADEATLYHLLLPKEPSVIDLYDSEDNHKSFSLLRYWT